MINNCLVVTTTYDKQIFQLYIIIIVDPLVKLFYKLYKKFIFSYHFI